MTSKSNLPSDSLKTIFVCHAIAYLAVLVNEAARNLFAYDFPKYRITFRRGILRLFHLGRHFPATDGADRQIAANCQVLFVRICDDVQQ